MYSKSYTLRYERECCIGHLPSTDTSQGVENTVDTPKVPVLKIEVILFLTTIIINLVAPKEFKYN